MIENKLQREEEKYLEPEARWVRNEERKRGTPLTQTVGKDKVRQSQTNLLTEQQKASQTTTGLDVEVDRGTVPNATVSIVTRSVFVTTYYIWVLMIAESTLPSFG